MFRCDHNPLERLREKDVLKWILVLVDELQYDFVLIPPCLEHTLFFTAKYKLGEGRGLRPIDPKYRFGHRVSIARPFFGLKGSRSQRLTL